MLTHQLSSKNLSPGEKLAMTEEFQEEVRLENEKKKLDGNKLGADITNGKTVSVQMDGERKSHTSPTHTREQRAKNAGVSVETLVRHNKVMNSNEEDITA